MQCSLAPRALLWAALAALALSGRAAAQQPQYEEGLYELTTPGLQERPTVITLVDQSGRVLLPLAGVLEFAGIPYLQSDSVVVLEWPPGLWRTAFDLHDGSIRAGSTRTVLARPDWQLVAGRAYLSPSGITKLIGAQVKLDASSLVAVLTSEVPLPALRALQLEAERTLRRATAGELPHPDRDTSAYPPRTGGLAADWGLSTSTQGAGAREVSATLGAALLGASVEAGGALQLNRTVADPFDGFLRVLRVWPHGRLLRSAQAGSIAGSGPLGIDIRGVVIGNGPYIAPEYFDEALVRPATPAGWTAEIYQGGQLLGVAAGPTAGPVRAPLSYGATPVRIRLIGPAGEEREEQIHYVVPIGRVPPGATQYTIGSGACRSDHCRLYSFADVRRGLTAWATVGAGADALRPDSGGPSRLRPYGVISLSPLRAVSLDLEGRVGTFGRAALQYYGGSGSTLTAALRQDLPGSPLLPTGGARGDVSASGSVLGRWFTVHALLQRSGGYPTGWQVSGASPMPSGMIALEYEQGLQSLDLLTVRNLFTPRPGRFWPASTSCSVAAGFARGNMATGEFTLTSQPVPFVSFNGAIQWRRSGGTPTLILGVAARLRGAMAQLRGTLHERSAAGLLSATGGLIGTRGFGPWPLVQPHRAVGNAGLAGTVFVDENGNGTRDLDEPSLPGVPVLFQGQRAISDSAGQFRAWNLPPYRPLHVALDTLKLADPSLAPRQPDYVIRPTPDVLNRVDVAVVRTREVSGAVQVPSSATAGGIALQVIDARGTITTEIRTFADGTFYISRVLPGSYLLRVSERSIQALGVSPPPDLRFTVPRTSGDTPIELPTLVLRRAGTPPDL